MVAKVCEYENQILVKKARIMDEHTRKICRIRNQQPMRFYKINVEKTTSRIYRFMDNPYIVN